MFGWLLPQILACGAAKPASPSVVLVSLDTLRADRLGAYGNPDGLTPNLDRFARESVLFERAYTQATLTTPSHAALFTSRYPPEVFGQGKAAVLTASTPTLASVLGTYGYETAASVGGGELSPELGLDAGFGVYASTRGFDSLLHTVPPALGWLDQRDTTRPFFLFVHGYDAHSEYLKPTPYGYIQGDLGASGAGQDALRSGGGSSRVFDGLLLADGWPWQQVSSTWLRPRSPEARAELGALARGMQPAPVPFGDMDGAVLRHGYDGAVAYADTMFGLLMAALEERDVLDDSIVIVISDHGEQLGEDGIYFRYSGVDEATAHVVLMVRDPLGVGAGTRVPGLVDLVDLMPTVLEAVGATVPAGARGVSFGPALRSEPFPGRPFTFTVGGLSLRWASVATATGRLTYLGVPPGAAEAADFAATAQLPGPAFTVAEHTPDAERETLRSALVGVLRDVALPPGAVRGAPGPALSRELQQSLRDHGYFDVDEQ